MDSNDLLLAMERALEARRTLKEFFKSEAAKSQDPQRTKSLESAVLERVEQTRNQFELILGRYVDQRVDVRLSQTNSNFSNHRNNPTTIEALISKVKGEYARNEMEAPVLLDGTSEMHARNALDHLCGQRWKEAVSEAIKAAEQRARWQHFLELTIEISQLTDPN